MKYIKSPIRIKNKIAIEKAALIHKGLSTHHHDQSIVSVNLSTTKTIVRIEAMGQLEADIDALFCASLLFICSSFQYCIHD